MRLCPQYFAHVPPKNAENDRYLVPASAAVNLYKVTDVLSSAAILSSINNARTVLAFVNDLMLEIQNVHSI